MEVYFCSTNYLLTKFSISSTGMLPTQVTLNGLQYRGLYSECYSRLQSHMRGLCCIPLSSTKSHETVHLQHHQMNIHRKYQHQQQAGNPPFGKMIWRDALINDVKSPSDYQKNQNGQTKFPLPIFQGQLFIGEVTALSTRKLIGFF